MSTKKESIAEPKVTSFDDLKSYAKGCPIELPPFGEGQPFTAILRRPSLLAMMKNGSIPNSLLNAADGLFTGKQQAKKNEESALGDTFDVMMCVAANALVEPTVVQLEEVGLDLTDEQLMFIFNYAQEGVKYLERFRSK